jgi:hypothetical protein
MFMCFVLCSVVLCSVCCCVNVEAVLQLHKVCVEGCVKHVERCMLFDAAGNAACSADFFEATCEPVWTRKLRRYQKAVSCRICNSRRVLLFFAGLRRMRETRRSRFRIYTRCACGFPSPNQERRDVARSASLALHTTLHHGWVGKMAVAGETCGGVSLGLARVNRDMRPCVLETCTRLRALWASVQQQ